MRKTLTASRTMLTRLMLVLAAVCFASSAKAVDFGAMQLDTDYAVTQYDSYSGVFTATSTGTLKIETVSGGVKINTIYADAEHTQPIEGDFSGFTASPVYYAYSVTEGTSYYLYSDFAWDAGTIRLVMDDNTAAMSITRISPVEGSALSVAGGYPYIDIYFDQKVGGITSCNLSCEGSVTKLPAQINDNTLHIDIQSALLSLYQAGVKGGAEITVSIDGLKNKGEVMYNGDGKLSLSYKLANQPVELVSAKVPEVFKSYWVPGDPDAVCTFTFSGDISTSMPADRVSLQFGSAEVEGNEFYSEKVPFSVEGAVITVDLAGVRRTPADMVASGTNYGNMLLCLNSICDAEGQPIYTSGQGTNGSLYFDWNSDKFVVMEKGTVIADFTPASGSSLADATEISVWIQGVSSIRFDGFTLSYTENGSLTEVLVPMTDVTVADNGNDARTYTFAIPAEIKGKKGVSVSLTNVVGIDGYDHADDVCASYDKFVITSIDPAGGSEIGILSAGTEITVTTNYAELYPDLYIVYEIEDLNAADPMDAIIKSESWLTRQEDDSYAATVYGSYKLYKDHKYAVRFTAWTDEMARNYQNPPVGSAEIYWYGTTAPFEYSPVTFVGITPDPQQVRLTPEDSTLVITFDGSVNISAEHAFINTGMGTQRNFESIRPINGSHEFDGVIYNDQWELTIDKSFLEGWDAALQVSIQAFDENGKVVKGNVGKEENTYFMFTYEMAASFREAEISPAAGSEVESLKRFTVSYPDGIGQSYFGEAYLMDLASRAQYALEVSMSEGDHTTGNQELYLDLESEITTPGTYILHIDEGFFILGSEFDSWRSAGVDAMYYVKEPEVSGEDDKRIITPDPSQALTELSSIDIIYPDIAEVGGGFGKATLAVNDQAPVNLPDAEYGMEWNEMVQPLGATYTESGTYVVSFPAGYFALGSNGDQSKAFVLVYTVGTVGVTDITADANGMYNVYNMAGVRVLSTANGADISTLAPGIYIINGKKIYKK